MPRNGPLQLGILSQSQTPWETESTLTRKRMRRRSRTSPNILHDCLKGEQCVKFIDFSCAFSQAPDPRAFRNSLNGLGLLAVPIEVLKEQIAERVRICEHADKPK